MSGTDDGSIITEDFTWLEDNTWMYGILLVLSGPIVATQGLKFFPQAVVGITALAVLSFLFQICTLFGWTDTNSGWWWCFSITLLLGLVAGWTLRKFIWLAVSFVGAFTGACGGIVLFDMIAAIAEWGPDWFWWTLLLVGGLVGFLAAFRIGAAVVNISTSFIGSFMFTRGLSFLFWTDHWPSQ
jgi:hypothetical protein